MCKKILFKTLLVTTVLSLATYFVAAELLRVEQSQAQVLALPEPTQLVSVSRGFSPSVLKGVKFNHDNPLELEFLIDQQDSQIVSEKTAQRLVHYFLAALTIPEGDMWVNLSPYEEDRIVPESLGNTDLGKDMLAQDYMLKQISSSLTHPDTELGQDYWKGVLGEDMMQQVQNSEFNKIWIMPRQADIVEYKSSAYVKEASLKLMTEQDYLAKEENQLSASDSSVSKIVKDLILPKLEDDINNGENFSRLRQIYYSLILAAWFKTKYQKSVFQYYIDQNKINGIDIADKAVKKKIWSLYCDSFNKGVYNAVRPYEYSQKRVKRTFFSGGETFETLSSTINVEVAETREELIVVTPKKGYTYKGKLGSNELGAINESTLASSIKSLEDYLGNKFRLSHTVEEQALSLEYNEQKKYYQLYIGEKLLKGSEFIFTEDNNNVYVNKIVIGYEEDKYKGLGIGNDIFEKLVDYAVLSEKDLEIKVTANIALLNMARKYAGDAVEYIPTVFEDAYRGNSLKDLLLDAEFVEIEMHGKRPVSLTYRYNEEHGLVQDIKDNFVDDSFYRATIDSDFRIRVEDLMHPERKVAFNANLETSLYNVRLPLKALQDFKNKESSSVEYIDNSTDIHGGIDMNELMVDTEIEAFDKVFVPFNLRAFNGFAFVPIELKKLDNPQTFVPML